MQQQGDTKQTATWSNCIPPRRIDFIVDVMKERPTLASLPVIVAVGSWCEGVRSFASKFEWGCKGFTDATDYHQEESKGC